MSSKLHIGVVGLGTVGAQVVARLVSDKVHAGLSLTAVCARDKKRERGLDLSDIEWVDDPLALAAHDKIDVVLELMGGADGAAYESVKTALSNGKHVVTANKAMMAAHGFELAQLAESHGVHLGYEAAVAGGIPVIKAMREGLAANQIHRVSGILNGTCNYILSEMTREGVDFAPALKAAQELGYAEANPEFDIDGIDAGQKLALLTSLAFGTRPDFNKVAVTGITNITRRDIEFADGFGCVIRLVGLCERTKDGILQWVGPCLVKKNRALAMIKSVTNAVQIDADMVGRLLLQGAGAGGDATASAVLSDVHDVLVSPPRPVFGIEVDKLASIKDQASLPACPWYLRLALVDAPGSMAEVTSILAEQGVSIEEVVQRGPENDDMARPVVFITHNVRFEILETALDKLRQLDVIDKQINCLPVLFG